MSTSAAAHEPSPAERDAHGRIWGVIAASSTGTIIEWYDFYIFGSLATTISPIFYPGTNPTISLLKWLAAFAVGFAVRPFGALVFGRLGDMVGRKYAFMLTLLIMGGSTAAIGLLPGYARIGVLAPILLVTLRMLQGLALGGEYGGAAVYVAEHSPDAKRGYYTSFIQTTATLGLFMSLLVMLGVRASMTEAEFKQWGWRIPFLVSTVLVVVSYWIRVRMRESPLFERLKEEGKTSTAPIADSFGTAARWKIFFLVLLGATAGQAVVWYTGQFYALLFLQSVLKVPTGQASKIVAIALLLATPLFVLFGALSDRIGRKKIIMAGCLVAALTYIPIYQAMAAAAGPTTSVTDAAGKVVQVAQGANATLLTALVWIQVIYVTMVYGPIAAFLVESFPARIRYTSMSLPYHIGNGWFGGFLPLIATWLAARHPENIYVGLYYPIAVSLLTVIVGTLFLRETRHVRIWHE